MATGTRLRRFTADEYLAMVDAGILGPDDRVELLDGEIVEMSPQGDVHGYVHERLIRVLVLAYEGSGMAVRAASTTRAGRTSAPEPDAAVVPPAVLPLPDVHGSVLVVEIADSSLWIDRRTKRAIYARAGAPCYWIVEVRPRQVRVLTRPNGDDYRDEVLLGEDDTLTLPLVGVEVAVAELLPPREVMGE
jgi:Uma2 family endonuclease